MKTQGTLREVLLSVLGPALALAAIVCASSAVADPTARIGRLSYFAGTVSFSPAGDDQWAGAVLNRPVITGDRLWSDNGARVELTLDNGALWLGAATSVVVSNIDDRTTQFELQQGTLDLRVRRLAQGQVVEIDTPNLAFQVARPGRYRIAVDPQSATTTVVVRNGAAEVYGERASYLVSSGQAYRFYGTDLRDSEYFTPRSIDEFERFVVERDSRFDRVVSARYVSPEVVGYEDLDRYGSWRPVESYGNVWFPQAVPTGWAPYRNGHWSWIDPWGWTWVDEAPWGFAPFHYGRWAYVQDRWGWVPGPVNVRPVYAPALVAFVGGANFSLSLTSGPAIGWFPLAPREVYRPAYNVSRDYYRQVNVSNTVINNTVINNTYVSNVTNTTAPVAQQVNYVNMRAPNALTAVPPAAFAQSQPVNRVVVRLPNAALDAAQIQSMASIVPARAAFSGAAPRSQAMPPATVQQQTTVTRSPLPPAPIPVAQKLQALERIPGKPLDHAEIQANRAPGSIAAPARNVTVVNPGNPTTAAPPPAVQGDAVRARTALPGAAPSPATQPPPTPAASERPDRRIDARGGDQGQPPRSPDAPRQTGAMPAAPAQIVPPRVAPPPNVAPNGAAPPSAPPPSDMRAIPQEPPRGGPQSQPPASRPPEQRAAPQEQTRPAPQMQPPMPRPPEARVVPQDSPRPGPQMQPPTPRPPEQRAVPQEQSRPAPQVQPPMPRPPEPSVVPQEQPRPAPQVQPPAPRPPEPRPVPPMERPAPQAQPPSPPQPGSPTAPKPENKRDDKSE